MQLDTPTFRTEMARLEVLLGSTETSLPRVSGGTLRYEPFNLLIHWCATYILASSYYQPETAYNIFTRTMFNKDVATRWTSLGSTSNYSTTGRSSNFPIKNTVPAPQQATCYIWDILETCTPGQKAMLQNDSAIVKDFLVVGFKSAKETAVGPENGTNTRSNRTSRSGGAQPKSGLDLG